MRSLDGFQREFAAALWDDAPTGRLGAQPAFAVYRNTVRKGCIDALEANFPAVMRLVGEGWFRSAAAEYVARHPPRDARLVEYGAGFGDFLRGLDATAELPYLADVARLDRDWVEAHTAADAPVLDATTLASLPPDTLASLRLRPHPAARWRWHAAQPSQAIWSCGRDPQGELGDIDWHGDGSLVTRPHDDVRWCAVPHAACVLLDRCAAGDPLGAAADAALADHPEADIAATLALLIGQGAFTHPSPFPNGVDIP